MWYCGVGVTEAVIPNTGDRVTYIAVGAGVGGGILIVMTVIVVGIVVTVILCTVGSRRGTVTFFIGLFVNYFPFFLLHIHYSMMHIDLSTGPDRDAELSATKYALTAYLRFVYVA